MDASRTVSAFRMRCIFSAWRSRPSHVMDLWPPLSRATERPYLRRSAVRAPLLLILAALDCLRRPLEAHSKIRTNGHYLRSAAGTCGRATRLEATKTVSDGFCSVGSKDVTAPARFPLGRPYSSGCANVDASAATRCLTVAIRRTQRSYRDDRTCRSGGTKLTSLHFERRRDESRPHCTE